MPRFRNVLVLTSLAILATACDVTHVAAPGLVLPSDVQNPEGALALRAGAVAELTTAFANQALFSGLLVDEFSAVSAFSSNFAEDQRSLNYQNSGDYPYAAMSKGRLDALTAIGALKTYAPDPSWHIAELYAQVAAAEIEFRENLCSGVPLGVLVNGTPTYGPSLTSGQLIVQALTDLDSAKAYATSSDSIAAFVAVLRSRALLDSGAMASAAAAIASVPLAFAYQVAFDTGAAQPSPIYAYLALYNQLTVSDIEGQNGLPFVSATDPRVPITILSTGNGNIAMDANDNSAAAPLTLASGIEAQLNLAEAALAAGDASTWSNTLNSLRQNAITPAMAPLTADSTTTATSSMQLAVMFRERAFWLFATGHRHGDLRRLVRQYHLSVTSVFPSGPYEGGPATYGSSVAFLPTGESYNPNFHGCVDTGA